MDASEFKSRYLPCHRRMFLTALRLTRNRQDAEDIVQDAFTKLWERRKEMLVERNVGAQPVHRPAATTTPQTGNTYRRRFATCRPLRCRNRHGTAGEPADGRTTHQPTARKATANHHAPRRGRTDLRRDSTTDGTD